MNTIGSREWYQQIKVKPTTQRKVCLNKGTQKKYDLAYNGRKSVLSWVERNPGASSNDISEALDISVDTIRRYLKDLRDEGLLEATAHSRGSFRWRCIS